MILWNNYKFGKWLLIHLIVICLVFTGCQTVVSTGIGERKESESGEPPSRSNWPDFDWKYLDTSDRFYSYNDSNYESKVLVDVSEHQKQIDWKEVLNAGVDSCIIRLGARYYASGKIKYDKNFDNNYQQAKEGGLSVYGVYFFSQAINAEEAEEEADFVIKKLKELSVPQDVMVFYDLESSKRNSYRNYNLNSGEVSVLMNTFANKIKKAGYIPAVYTNGKWGDKALDLSIFSEYGIWYARYRVEPDLNSGFFLWQYSKSSKIPGISTNVDLNLLLLKKNK